MSRRGVVLLGAFVWQQRRSSHPTIDMALFANRRFSAGTTALALTFFGLAGSGVRRHRRRHDDLRCHVLPLRAQEFLVDTVLAGLAPSAQ